MKSLIYLCIVINKHAHYIGMGSTTIIIILEQKESKMSLNSVGKSQCVANFFLVIIINFFLVFSSLTAVHKT